MHMQYRNLNKDIHVLCLAITRSDRLLNIENLILICLRDSVRWKKEQTDKDVEWPTY